jgi:integrase/recombinase XerD
MTAAALISFPSPQPPLAAPSQPISEPQPSAFKLAEPPVVTIYVRHSESCSHTGDEFYKRCDCRKWVRWTGHEGEQQKKTTKCRTWAGAERFRSNLMDSFAAIIRGKSVSDTRQSVTPREAVDKFLSAKRGENLDRQIQKKYERELGRFVDFCAVHGKRFLSDVTLPDLIDYRSTWPNIYPKTTTRQKVQERLRSFFRFCALSDFAPKNVALGLKPINVEDPDVVPLADEQFDALLLAISKLFHGKKAAKVRALVLLMRHTGLAISDAVKLPRTALDWDKTLKVHRVVLPGGRTKTGNHVSVAIQPGIAAEILAVENSTQRYFFWTGVGKLRSAVGYWQRNLLPAFRAAKIENGHPHQLRHTAVVHWLANGLGLEDVAALLGDTIKVVEKHYAKWAVNRQRRLDKLVMATW